MFVFFPYATDAPVYHFPYATIGLIAANTLIHIVVMALGGNEISEVPIAYDYYLWFGRGLHPIQWLTSDFLHADIFHLLFNMLFLWTFGLVVEGKLGWWKTLLAYFSLAILECAITQIWTLGFSEGSAIGASGVISAFLGLAIIWAPKNEFTIFGIFWMGWIFRVFNTELAILTAGLIYIGMQIATMAVEFLLWGVNVSGEVLHMLGLGLGLLAGMLSVKLHWVDCEHWDLFAVWEGRAGKSKQDFVAESGSGKRRSEYRSRFEEAEQVKKPSVKKLRTRLTEHLTASEALPALSLYEQLREAQGLCDLTEEQLVKLIELLYADRLFVESIQPLEDYLMLYQEHQVAMRLRLAKVLVDYQTRPAYALKILKGISSSQELPARFSAMRDKIVEKANKQIEEGVLELEGKNW